MKYLKQLLLGFLISLAAKGFTATNGHPGSLDSSFVVTNSVIVGSATCFAIQPDGKILVGGWYGIHRLRVDGAVDSSLRISVNSSVQGVRIDSNGVITAFGYFSTANGSPVPGLAKFQSDGTLANFNPSILPAQTVKDAIPLGNGKVVIAGTFTNVNGRLVQGLVRLNADGSLDNTFATTTLKGATYRIAFDPENYLWVLGDNRNVLRLTENGSPAPNFSFDPASLMGNSSLVLGVQADSKAIIGAYLPATNGFPGTELVRLNTNGTVDTNFSFRSRWKWVSSMDFQPDGKILIGGGFAMSNGVSGVGRLWSNGQQDTNFYASIPGGAVGQIRRHPDGRVLVAGTFQAVNGIPWRSPARLWGDPFQIDFVDPRKDILQFSVPIGSIYTLQASDDLQTWKPLVTNRAVSLPITYTSPTAHQVSQRYYRVQILE